MAESRFQLSVGGLILLVACVALNFWLFRQGFFYGLIGLNVSKHILIAFLCKAVGVDRRSPAEPPAPVAQAGSHTPTITP